MGIVLYWSIGYPKLIWFIIKHLVFLNLLIHMVYEKKKEKEDRRDRVRLEERGRKQIDENYTEMKFQQQ